MYAVRVRAVRLVGYGNRKRYSKVTQDAQQITAFITRVPARSRPIHSTTTHASYLHLQVLIVRVGVRQHVQRSLV